MIETITFDGEKYYQTGRAAEIVGVSKGHLSKLIRDGKVKAIHEPSPYGNTGYMYLIPESEVERLKTIYSGSRPRAGRPKKVDTVEEVPMTEEEIKDRLPEDVRDRYIPESTKDDIIVELKAMMGDSLNNLHARNIKLVESNKETQRELNDIQASLEDALEEIRALREELAESVTRTHAFEAMLPDTFMKGYEKGFVDGSYVRKEYKTNAERYSNPNVSYTGRFGNRDE